MKKSTILLLAVVYIVSFFVIGLLGHSIRNYNPEIYPESIEIVDPDNRTTMTRDTKDPDTGELLYDYYFVYKNYPMDYKPDGSLIVDPHKMMTDAFGGVGRYLGILIGWYIETLFIKFTVPENKKHKCFIGIFGIVTLYCVSKLIPNSFYQDYCGLGEHARLFTKGFIPFFFIMAVYPCFIKLFQVKIMTKEQTHQITEDKIIESVKTE